MAWATRKNDGAPNGRWELSSGFEEPKVVGLVLYVECLRVLQIKGCMLVEMCGKQLVILVWGSE